MLVALLSPRTRWSDARRHVADGRILPGPADDGFVRLLDEHACRIERAAQSAAGAPRDAAHRKASCAAP
ncbi:MAG: hypothetical protein ABW178_11500 [Pseudoxanthomonas sp.]